MTRDPSQKLFLAARPFANPTPALLHRRAVQIALIRCRSLWTAKQLDGHRSDTIGRVPVSKAMKSVIPQYPFSCREKFKECTFCGRPRSRRYRESQNSEPLVCSKCAKWKDRTISLPNKIIVEIHHHYCGHNPDGDNIRTASASEQRPLIERFEMPGDVPSLSCLGRTRLTELSTIFEEAPPPVNWSTKPTVQP